MQHLEQRIEITKGCLQCLAVDGRAVGWLHHFQVPTGELVPEQAVYGHQRIRNAVFAEVVVEFSIRLTQFGSKPFRGDAALRRLFDVGHLKSFHQTEGIPYLVVEVASLLAENLVEEDVVAGRGGEHHAHTHAVGSILVDEFDGVGGVAEALRHLPAQFVAHDTGEIDVLEGECAHVLLAGHDHACHPEENDIRTCHQVGSGVVVAYLIVVRIVDSVKQRYRPQP